MNKTRLMNQSGKIVLVGALFLASSCMLGPDYERPDLNVPAEFRMPDGGAVTNDSIANLAWWELFKNSDLQSLIKKALSNNKNLAVAYSRCAQARESVTITRSPLFPQASYGGGLGRGENSSYGSTSPTGANDLTGGQYNVNASWQLDFWGNTRRKTEAAQADYLATEEARRGVILSLIGQVASSYLQLLELDTELAITKKTVQSFQESLDLFRQQLQGGIGDVLQVSSAEAALASAQASIPQIETQMAQLENSICLLLGEAPHHIERSGELNDLYHSVNVPAGMPCQLLSRRPDLRQAEQKLRSANANVGVAITNYFPTFSLTSSVGQVSADLENTSLKASRSWGLGANLTGPLFRAGALNAAERQAKEAFTEAKLNYEQTMLTALKEVANGLVARVKVVGVIDQRRKSVSAYETAVAASRDRFKTGLSSYYEVLQAQQNLFPEEIKLAQSRLQYVTTVVELYVALGGGWQNID